MDEVAVMSVDEGNEIHFTLSQWTWKESPTKTMLCGAKFETFRLAKLCGILGLSRTNTEGVCPDCIERSRRYLDE